MCSLRYAQICFSFFESLNCADSAKKRVSTHALREEM
jgi:hypothetical protein